MQPLTDMNKWVRSQVVAPLGARAPDTSLGRAVGQGSRKPLSTSLAGLVGGDLDTASLDALLSV
jgi:hypothetical protein